MNTTISVILIDDHTLFREAVAEVLLADPQLMVVGQGATAQEAVCLTERLHPDIVVLDLGIPGGGLNSAKIMVKEHPDSHVIILTSSESEDNMIEAHHLGVSAYLLKGISGRELIDTIHAVCRNDCHKFLTQFDSS
jgi:two-component system nitrate/nitrite response regulator NarL